MVDFIDEAMSTLQDLRTLLLESEPNLRTARKRVDEALLSLRYAKEMPIPPARAPQAVPESRYLSVKEAGKYLGVPWRTVASWIASGTMPSRKIGGRRLIAVADLDRK
jgi:excisionase family DNA binding protein